MSRILLIEDDASIQRFVELALDDIGAELVITDTVRGGLQALGRAQFDLILTDLMLPGESGITLLERLREQPGTAAQAKVVVFSAGLTPAIKTQLQELGVWRMLSKPISVLNLLGCVEEALENVGSASTSGSAPSSPAAGEAETRNLSAAEQDAIATHFNGDTGLFLMYRDTCLVQFGVDIQTGDLASQAGDLPALRRLGHSLKTVLHTLAAAEGAQQARSLEDMAAQHDAAASLGRWQDLRAALLRLRQNHGLTSA